MRPPWSSGSQISCSTSPRPINRPNEAALMRRSDIWIGDALLALRAAPGDVDRLSDIAVMLGWSRDAAQVASRGDALPTEPLQPLGPAPRQRRVRAPAASPTPDEISVDRLPILEMTDRQATSSGGRRPS